MRIYLYCIALFAVNLTAACSTKSLDDPIIDTAGVDMEQYQVDLAQCKEYAEQVEQKAGAGAAGGAAVGAVIGAIVGDSRTAAKGAGVGAVTGGVKGGAATQKERERVVKNCLRGRGYKVLN
ncbi:MAG: glycine zipper family protein [Gammaproteobacteria bacterium]|nr:MAG: glycine zipper family protein [Gammaproteobacteria bacterium]UCH40091.1 MAG: glycine zipper family protein [Gammaproteobacteria bacterium]